MPNCNGLGHVFSVPYDQETKKWGEASPGQPCICGQARFGVPTTEERLTAIERNLNTILDALMGESNE